MIKSMTVIAVLFALMACATIVAKPSSDPWDVVKEYALKAPKNNGEHIYMTKSGEDGICGMAGWSDEGKITVAGMGKEGTLVMLMKSDEAPGKFIGVVFMAGMGYSNPEEIEAETAAKFVCQVVDLLKKLPPLELAKTPA